MTVYDPIEVWLGGQIAQGQGLVYQTDGYAVYRGVMVRGCSATIDEEENLTGYFSVDLAWNTSDSRFPLPQEFINGTPNVSYKVTIQAIDSTEE